MQSFSIEESLHTASSIFRKRPWFFIGIAALLLVLSFIINFINSYFANAGGFIELIGFVLSMLASLYVGLIQTKIFLRAHDAIDDVHLREGFTPSRIANYFGVAILLTIGIIIGFILLIIPGILLSLSTMFAIYIVIDTGAKPMDAIKESMRLTRGHWLHLFLFSLSLLVVNAVGALALLVGLLVTIPISLLATVHVYRSLKKNYMPEVVKATGA